MQEPFVAHYVFRQGLPAFEQDRQYRLTACPDWRPFLTLESEREGGPRFTCVEIDAIQAGYQFDLSPEDAGAIDESPASNCVPAGGLLCLAIVAELEDGALTANLAAPLIFSTRNGLGVQSIQPAGAFSPLTVIRGAKGESC